MSSRVHVLCLECFTAFEITKPFNFYEAELQIRVGIEDNSKIFFFLFLKDNIRCDP